MDCPLLILDKINHKFHQKGRSIQVINHLSLNLNEGEIISIVGTSGCGKSTLLRIIAGLLTSTSGQITIAGKSPLETRREGDISFVFQKSLLFPWLTVLDNILLPIRIQYQKVEKKDKNKALELLNLLNLTGSEERYPYQLSGGMLQRAALARALMTNPKLLLLDEPFSAIDEITRENLWLDFYRIWRQQKLSVILVSHSIKEAAFFGDRVIVLSSKPGTIKAEFKVNLGQSRDYKVTLLPQFIELCEQIRDQLSL